MRLFLAIEVPDQVLLKTVRVQRSLREFNRLVKWVEKENLHLTVEFLGEVATGRLDELVRGYQEQFKRQPCFKLRLNSGIVFFPSPWRPRVMVLKAVVMASEWGQSEEFHLTLGRVRSRATLEERRQLVETTRKIKLEEGGDLEFIVKEIVLKESRLSVSGPQYFDLARFVLVKQGKLYTPLL